LRVALARMEGAAKRLLDALGCPVDGRRGPEATVEALRAAADARGDKAPASGMVRGDGGTWEF
jgi:hypothetical protein